MSLLPLCRRVDATAVAVVMGLSVLTACSAASSPAAPAVVALRVGAPVYQPVWSDHAGALYAVTEDGSRIAKIDPSRQSGSPPAARTVLSEPFPDVGEDLACGFTGRGLVYLPQPRLGRVAVVSGGDLHQVASLRAGPAPSFLAVDSGSADLLALSEDRSTVTPVDMHDNTTLPARHVRAGPEAELDTGKRGRLIDYHVASLEGITHYEGSPGSVENKGEIWLRAEKTISDLIKPSRVYVAEKGTDRLLAVDSRRTGEGMHIVAQAKLDGPVHYLGVDETLIYAATEHTLVVLETNSFEGYHNETIPIVAAIDFRSALPGDALKNAPLSGLAVGPNRVYLTFRRQPYVVSVAKPGI